MSTLDTIKSHIQDNPIIIFMKGSPVLPQCGFSARAVAALKELNVNFAYVDVLANPDIRAELPHYANWPTFPQLYINGELIGGSDIILELHANGELQQLVNSVQSTEE